MTSVTGGGVTATLSYDPLGRLWHVLLQGADVLADAGPPIEAEKMQAGGGAERCLTGIEDLALTVTVHQLNFNATATLTVRQSGASIDAGLPDTSTA